MDITSVDWRINKTNKQKSLFVPERHFILGYRSNKNETFGSLENCDREKIIRVVVRAVKIISHNDDKTVTQPKIFDMNSVY